MEFPSIDWKIIHELQGEYLSDYRGYEQSGLFLLATKNDEQVITRYVKLYKVGGCPVVPGTTVKSLFDSYVKLSKDGYTIVGMALLVGGDVYHMLDVNKKKWFTERKYFKVVGYGGIFVNDLPLLVLAKNYPFFQWYSKQSFSLERPVGFIPHKVNIKE